MSNLFESVISLLSSLLCQNLFLGLNIKTYNFAEFILQTKVCIYSPLGIIDFVFSFSRNICTYAI